MSQLSEGDIDKMKVEELKKELKKRSCTVGGKKAELQQRLIRSIASEKCLLKSFISQGSSQGSSPPDNLANERDAEKNGQSVRLAPRHGDDQESAAANTRKLVEGAWGAPRRTEGELLASAVQATSSRPAVFMTAGMETLQRSETQNKRTRYEPGSYSDYLSRTLIRFNLEEYSPQFVKGECLFVSFAFNISYAAKLVSPVACAIEPSDVRLEIAAIYEDQENHAFLDDWMTDTLKLARPNGSEGDRNDFVYAERAKMMRHRAECGNEETEDLWEWGTDMDIAAMVLSRRKSVLQFEPNREGKGLSSSASDGGAVRHIYFREAAVHPRDLSLSSTQPNVDTSLSRLVTEYYMMESIPPTLESSVSEPYYALQYFPDKLHYEPLRRRDEHCLDVLERPAPKQKEKYDRYKMKEKWKRPWLRYGLRRSGDTIETVWCIYCINYPAYRCSDKIATGDQLLSKLLLQYIKRHEGTDSGQGQYSKHQLAHHRCQVLYLRSKSSAGSGPGLMRFGYTLTDKKEIIGRIIVTCYSAFKKNIEFHKIPDLVDMQSKNGLEMGDGDYMNDTFWSPLLAMFGDMLREQQKDRMTRAGCCSILGDGSANVLKIETEIIYGKYKCPDRKKIVVEFMALCRVRCEESKDGLSCDANALFSTYDAHLKKEVPELSMKYDETLVSLGFDGASVMLGKTSSVAALFAQRCEHVVATHAAAHRLELGARSGLCVPFLMILEDVLAGVYSNYHLSPKKLEGMDQVAQELHAEACKYVKMHGIRWLASKTRAIEAWLKNWKVLVVHLQAEAFRSVGLSFTTRTPEADFIGKRVTFEFDGKPSTGTIMACSPHTSAPSIHTERFTVKWDDRSTTEYSKQEICNALMEELGEDSPKRRKLLAKCQEWDLYITNTQYRVVKTMSFMHDINGLLGRLSKSFQNDQVVVSDITSAIKSVIVSLTRMLEVDGPQLGKFAEEFSALDSHYMGIPLDNVEEGEKEFKEDRKEIIYGLIAHLEARFAGYQDHPVLSRLSAFEHRVWPLLEKDLEEYGNSYVKWLFNHFRSLTVLKDIDVDEAVREWQDLKRDLITTTQHRDLKFVEFWTWVFTHYENRYPNILKLICVVLIIVMDTSCCERGFALMNRTHTEERDRLKVETVNDLLMIMNLGPDVEDLDVQDMVGRWLHASTKGRQLGSKFNNAFGLDLSGDGGS